MRKQLIATVLITIMTTLILTLPTVQIAFAQQHDIDGEDLGYNEAVSLGYSPWYCECNHNVWMGDPGDSEAGLGLVAQYCLVGYPQNPMFNYAHWMFEGECGTSNVAMFDSLSIDPCVNGNDHHYYNYYGTLNYGPPPWNPPPAYSCYYHYFDLSSSIDPAYSAEAWCAQAFYNQEVPWITWFIEAYTQNPPYDPYGDGWAYLSAHW